MMQLPEDWDDSDYTPSDVLRYIEAHLNNEETAELLITRDGTYIRFRDPDGQDDFPALMSHARSYLGY